MEFKILMFEDALRFKFTEHELLFVSFFFFSELHPLLVELGRGVIADILVVLRDVAVIHAFKHEEAFDPRV